MIWLIPLVTGFAASIALHVGWRGQRIGDAPYCRACGFELTGIPPDCGKCPECGAPIADRGDVVRGRLARRWRVFSVGVFLSMLCIAMLILAVQGRFSTSGLAAVLSTDRLVEWSITRPNRLLGWEGYSELAARVGRGALTSTQQRQLAHALEAALPDRHGVSAFALARLHSELLSSPATADRVRDEMIRYVLERQADRGGRWYGDWERALAELEASGKVTQEEWDRYSNQAYALHLWRTGPAELMPGEELVLGLDFGPRFLSPAYELVFLQIDLGEEFQRIGEPSSGWTDGPNALPGPLAHISGPRALLRAPEQAGEYRITAQLWRPPPGTDPRALQSEDDLQRAGAESTVTSLAIKVATNTARPPDADRTAMKRWLEGRVYFGECGGYSQSGAVAECWLSLCVGGAEGSFEGAGELIAVGAGGHRQVLGEFRAGRPGSYTSRTGGHVSFGFDEQRGIAEIRLAVDTIYLEPDAPWRLVLSFKGLELPDGRNFEGPERLEIDIPPGAMREAPTSIW